MIITKKSVLGACLSILLVVMMLASYAVITPVNVKAETVKTPFDLTAKSGYSGSWGADMDWNDNVGGIGGKASDDYAVCLTSKSTTAQFSGYRYKNDLWFNNTIYEFNMYADGNAVAEIDVLDSGVEKHLLTWAVDGTISYTATGGEIVTAGNYERGRWHRIALSHAGSGGNFGVTSGGYFALWIDGVKISGAVSNSWLSTLDMKMGIAKNSEAGRVAFDDAVSYTTDYTPDPEITLSVDSVYEDVVKSDDNTIYLDFTQIASLDDLSSALVLNEGAAVRLFKDSTLKTEQTDGKLANGQILVIESAEKLYKYYNIKEMSLELVDNKVEFVTDSNGHIGATAYFTNMTKDSVDAIMIMVLKNSDGVIEAIRASDTISVEGTNIEVSISPVDVGTLTPEVFFIKDWTTRLRLIGDIFKK